MKPPAVLVECGFLSSLSARRAWIETRSGDLAAAGVVGRSPQGGRGLKRHEGSVPGYEFESLSARRAWIETLAGYEDAKTELVALRKEGVD